MIDDSDDEVVMRASSTSREALEHLCRACPFIDLPEDCEDDIRKDETGRYSFVYWNGEDQRMQIKSWAERFYPSNLYYGIHLDDVSDQYNLSN
ncbi:hypothetical protein M2360_004576 [Rhizobium sp. SG_E_25_P2]|nr:hypothetical protein [Rhizobium sp. SG_E_25_P2]